MRGPVTSPGGKEGKMVNKQEVTAAIQEKHQETIEKLNRLWEQYNKEFNENPRNAIKRNISKIRISPRVLQANGSMQNISQDIK